MLVVLKWTPLEPRLCPNSPAIPYLLRRLITWYAIYGTFFRGFPPVGGGGGSGDPRCWSVTYTWRAISREGAGHACGEEIDQLPWQQTLFPQTVGGRAGRMQEATGTGGWWGRWTLVARWRRAHSASVTFFTCGCGSGRDLFEWVQDSPSGSP